ncbi:hypothetical protein ARMSODRAFT_765660 [Armillaria solidipes]|uniref:Uncharacterized protein n=1 Tax=Armillaria solidipes TaxID=1076256 RepID=A0A2H3AM70_9AGAR|nr:hypothetical protein ARMSODRAFT_765660 [Armillaria solidipes]
MKNTTKGLPQIFSFSTVGHNDIGTRVWQYYPRTRHGPCCNPRKRRALVILFNTATPGTCFMLTPWVKIQHNRARK